VNDTFNIGAKEFTTMKEDYQAVLDKAGFGKKIIGLPATPIIWTLRMLEVLHLSPLYKWVYETASKDSFVSIEKAEKILDYKDRVDRMFDRLEVANPLHKLRQGYSIVTLKRTGMILKSIRQIKSEDLLVTRLIDGKIESRLESVYEN